MKSTKSIILIALIQLFIFTNSFSQWNAISGKGEVVKQELNLASFDGFELGISGELYLMHGPQKVVIEAQQNIIDNLQKEVKNGNWEIEFDQNIKNHKSIRLYVTMPSFKNIGLSGSGNIIGEDHFKNLDNVKIGLSGSGDIQVAFDAQNLSIGISGSGNIDLTGSTNDQKIGISGSGRVQGYDMNSDNCKISISGSGDCKVNAENNLEVAIAGSGDVKYKGSPKVKANIAGSGDVQSAN